MNLRLPDQREIGTSICNGEKRLPVDPRAHLLPGLEMPLGFCQIRTQALMPAWNTGMALILLQRTVERPQLTGKERKSSGGYQMRSGRQQSERGVPDAGPKVGNFAPQSIRRRSRRRRTTAEDHQDANSDPCSSRGSWARRRAKQTNVTIISAPVSKSRPPCRK